MPPVSLLTAAEVAERFRVKKATIHLWCMQGYLPFIRLGPRSVRIRLDVIERLELEGVPDSRRSPNSRTARRTG
jgi:excisionase family DNA binding protein